MRYKKFLISVVLLLTFYGCDEFINITGIFTNRLISTSNVNVKVNVFLKNNYGDLIPNFRVSIINSADSSVIVTSKFTEKDFPISFDFPDEQIQPLLPDDKILILANHPSIGTFVQELKLFTVENHMVIVEFNVGLVSDSLSMAPLRQYNIFKVY